MPGGGGTTMPGWGLQCLGGGAPMYGGGIMLWRGAAMSGGGGKGTMPGGGRNVWGGHQCLGGGRNAWGGAPIPGGPQLWVQPKLCSSVAPPLSSISPTHHPLAPPTSLAPPSIYFPTPCPRPPSSPALSPALTSFGHAPGPAPFAEVFLLDFSVPPRTGADPDLKAAPSQQLPPEPPPQKTFIGGLEGEE